MDIFKTITHKLNIIIKSHCHSTVCHILMIINLFAVFLSLYLISPSLSVRITSNSHLCHAKSFYISGIYSTHRIMALYIKLSLNPYLIYNYVLTVKSCKKRQ